MTHDWPAAMARELPAVLTHDWSAYTCTSELLKAKCLEYSSREQEKKTPSNLRNQLIPNLKIAIKSYGETANESEQGALNLQQMNQSKEPKK